MSFKIYSQYRDYAHRLDVYIFEENPDGGRSLCTSLDNFTFEKVDPVVMDLPPTLTLGRGMSGPFLQAMANMLKEHNIRPDGEEVIEGEMAAVKYHLEDMRNIVFKNPKDSGK